MLCLLLPFLAARDLAENSLRRKLPEQWSNLEDLKEMYEKPFLIVPFSIASGAVGNDGT